MVPVMLSLVVLGLDADGAKTEPIVSSSVSSSIPRPQIESVARRLAFVSAFIRAFASASPFSVPSGTAPVLASVRPVLPAGGIFQAWSGLMLPGDV